MISKRSRNDFYLRIFTYTRRSEVRSGSPLDSSFFFFFLQALVGRVQHAAQVPCPVDTKRLKGKDPGSSFKQATSCS